MLEAEGTTSTTTPASAGSDDVLARLEAKLSGEAPTAKTPPADTEGPAAPQPEEGAEEQDTDGEGQDETGKKPEAKAEGEEQTDDNEISLEVSHFAQLLGVDEDSLIVDEDGTVSLRTKVDGEVGKVKVQDLIRAYQTDAHVTRKSQALSEERKAFETAVAEKSQEIQTRITEVSSAVQLLESQLTHEYQSIDWAGLKATDPGRWAVVRQEFQDRVAAINAAKQKAFGVLQTQVQEQQQRQETARLSRLQREAESLRTKLPEWNDPEVAQKQHSAMSEFLATSYGFDPGDINGVEDHRLILLAQDAMKYRQGLKAGAEAVKKVVSLPRLQKPGVQRVNAEAAAKQAVQQKKIVRLRQTGSTADLASLLADRI